MDYRGVLETHNRAVTRKGAHQIDNALFLAQIKGYRVAAEYLRKLGWSLEGAKWALLGK